jgi:hypothetical protein
VIVFTTQKQTIMSTCISFLVHDPQNAGQIPQSKERPPGGRHQHLPVLASLWSHLLLPVRDEVLGRLLLLLLPALLVHLFAWRGVLGGLTNLDRTLAVEALIALLHFLLKNPDVKVNNLITTFEFGTGGGAKEEVLSFCMLVTAWR